MSEKSNSFRTKLVSKGGKRRKNEPFPGLVPGLHPRARREYMDQDYFDKLSPDEKAFMSKFMEEYYGAALTPKDQVEKQSKDLHNTPKLRKDCTDRNNARNRDVCSMSGPKGRVATFEDKFGRLKEAEEKPLHQNRSSFQHEDMVLELLDLKQKIKGSSLQQRKKPSDNKPDSNT